MAIYAGDREVQQVTFPAGTQMGRVLGVYVGTTRIFPPAGRTEEYLFTAGASGGTASGNQVLFSPSVPWWAVAVDVIAIGGGGGGHGGDGTISRDGQGGRAAAWQSGVIGLTRAEGDFLNTFSVRVGKGGSGGSRGKSGTAGAESKVSYGMQLGPSVSSPGGAAGSGYGDAAGQSASNFTRFGMSFPGGTGGSREQPGGNPGAGGGGGKGGIFGSATAGAAGGNGSVWIRFRSDPPSLEVGVSSGDAFTPLRDWAASIGETHETITEITVPMEVIGPSLQRLFRDCYALTSIPALDTSQVKNMAYMFYNCYALTSIPALDTSQAAYISDMFYGCSSLESVTLPGMGNGFTARQTLAMRTTVLNAAAANALMQSLGTPPPGGTLELPATAAGADTTIATAKNWTVTFG